MDAETADGKLSSSLCTASCSGDGSRATAVGFHSDAAYTSEKWQSSHVRIFPCTSCRRVPSRSSAR